jgi:hypothetical protein
MFRKLKCAALILGILVISVSAQASSLYFSGSSQEVLLKDVPGRFDLYRETGLSGDEILTVFSGDRNSGLRVRNATSVTFEYLGSEAGYLNQFQFKETDRYKHVFINDDWRRKSESDVGDEKTFNLVNIDTLLQFRFWTSGEFSYDDKKKRDMDDDAYIRNGYVRGDYSIAFSEIVDNTVIAFLGDGFGDSDFDDMAVRISVEAVPLPAALPLFLTALGGFGIMRYRKNKA